MYITRNIFKIVFVYCPVLIVLLGLGAYVQKNINSITYNLPKTVSQGATEFFGVPCKVESITLTGATLTLKNISIKDRVGADMAQAEEVVLRLNPLFIKSGASPLKNIIIKKAHLSIYRIGDKWNFQFITDIFKKQNITPTDFRGPVIYITDSDVKIKDNITKYSDYLQDIDLRMDLRSQNHPSLSAGLSSDYIGRIIYSTAFDVPNHRAIIKADISQANLNAISKYTHLIPKNKYSDLINKSSVWGTLDGNVSLLIKNSAIADCRLKAQGKDINLSTPYGKIEKGNFYFEKDNNTYKVSANLSCFGTKAYIKGITDLSDPNSTNISLTAKNINPDSFRKHMPKDLKNLKGKGDLTANLTGSLNSPEIFLKFKGKDLYYEGLKLKSIAAKAHYKNTDFMCECEAKDFRSSVLTAKGTLKNINLKDIKKKNFKNITTDAHITARNINISSYIPFEGILNSDFSVKGKVTEPKISANISLAKGVLDFGSHVYKDIDIKCSLSTEKKKLTVKSGLIKGFYDTDIIFSGSVDSKINISASLFAGPINLEKIGKDFNTDIKGNVSLTSKFTKTENKIFSNGLVNISNFSYENQNFNHIQANYSITPYSITINRCTILDFPATFIFRGIISPDKYLVSQYDKEYFPEETENEQEENQTENVLDSAKEKYADFLSLISEPQKSDLYFCINADGKNFSNKNLLKHLNKEDNNIKAISDFSVILQGKYDMNTVRDLKGTGSINIESMDIYDNRFNNVFANISVNDNTVYLTDIHGDAVSFNVFDTNSFGTAEGECSYCITDGKLEGTLKVNNLSLSEYRDYIKEYASVFGMVQAECSLHGTVNKEIQDINCSVTSNIPILSINGKTYRNVKLNTEIKNSDLVSGDLIISKDNQSLTASLKDFSIKNRTIANLNVRADHISVNDMREIFYLSPFAKEPKTLKVLNSIPVITEGEINGTATCSGSVDSLNGSAVLWAEGINADFDRLESVKAELSATKGTVNLDSLIMKGTEFSLTANAYPLLEKGKTNISVDLSNLPLERFGKYINFDNTKGNLALSANICGNIKEPTVTASLNIDRPCIDKIEMQSVSVPKISADSQYITIEKPAVINMTDNNIIKAEGKIPTDILSKESAKKEISLNVYAPEQDFDFIEVLIPNIDRNTTKGIFNARVSINGTVEKPSISGNLELNKGEIHTIGNTCLSDINAKATLSQTEDGSLLIDISKLSFADNNGTKEAFKANGGYIKIANPANTQYTSESRNSKDSAGVRDILDSSEISVHADIKNYRYKCSDFSPFSDSSDCVIDGNIDIKGNLTNPRIYSEKPIVLKNLHVSAKASSKEDTQEQNAIIAMADKQKNPSSLLSYTDAKIYDDIITSARLRQTEHAFIDPMLDLKIIADNTEIRIPSTYAKAQCQADIGGYLTNPHIKGSVKISDGKTSFQIARARFVKDSEIQFEFKDYQPELDMNLEAFSYVHYEDKNGYDERYKITIYITGGLDNYDVRLESDPEGLSEREILTAFTGIRNNSINTKESLAKLGANTILSPIEDFFVEQLGFSSLGFEYSENKYAIINIERSFGKKWYGSFYSNLYGKDKSVQNQKDSNISEWELKLGYKLNQQFRINAGINANQDKKFDISYGFRF